MEYKILINPNQLFQNINNPNWVIVDSRFWLEDTEKGRRDYLAGHIPGAIYAHIDEDLSSLPVLGMTGRHPLPPAEEFSAKLSAWGIDSTVQVVVYDDRGGIIAGRLWWMLRWLGHNSVAVLDGGIPRWKREGFPTTDDFPVQQPRFFVPNPQQDMLVDAEEILGRFGDPNYLLIDGRASERYRGEIEPIDAVAGHIPGAVNLPISENLDDQGNFKKKKELRARYKKFLTSKPTKKIVNYCGSGVTSVHNILAMMHAGLGDGQLYLGSWSDWITDPEHPIATSFDVN